MPEYYNYYGQGDRFTGLVYDIMQFNLAAYQNNNNFGFVKVGHWARNGASPLYQLCNGSSILFGPSEPCPYSVIFNTANNAPPADHPPAIYVEVPNAQQLIDFGSVLIALLVILAVVVVIYRKESVLKMAQPTMLLLIILGEIIGAIRIIITGLNLNDSLCKSQDALGHLGFWMVFGPYVLKLWRINRVMNTMTLLKVKVTIFDTLKYFAYIYVFMIFYLIVSLAIVDTKLTYVDVIKDNQLTRYTSCAEIQPQALAEIPLNIAEVICVLYCIWLGYAVKELPAAFNEFYPALLSGIGIIVVAAVIVLQIVFPTGNPTDLRYTTGIAYGVAIVWTTLNLVCYRTFQAVLGYKVTHDYDVKARQQSNQSLGSAAMVGTDIEQESDPFIKQCLTDLRYSPSDAERFQYCQDKVLALKGLMVRINDGYFQVGRAPSAGAAGTASRRTNNKVAPTISG